MSDARGLRILVDGSMARGGGGHTYLANVVPRLSERAPEHHFLVLIRSPQLADRLEPRDRVEIRVLPTVGWAGRLRFAASGAYAIAREFGAQVYFSVAEDTPLRAPCPIVASFRNPNLFDPEDRGWSWPQRVRIALLRAVARRSARASARVMFVSEDSAHWLGERAGVPSSRRAVVHHGIDPRLWTDTDGEAGAPLERPYVLSVSSIYRYKNYVRLIEAWARMASALPDAPDLVIVGDDQDPDHSRAMQAARRASGALAERIHLVGAVPYEEVPAWYRGARLFVFPSLLETFGHPLLEAMAASVPVLASDTPVSREIAGEAASFVDARDVGALGDAMQTLCSDPERRRVLVARGHERVAAFSWERSVDALVAMLSDVATRSAPPGVGG